ncbi:MAG TPA: phytanoyl-CoA dioxygenase family protein [Methylomirabilota bacterium]|nr:phytanoyl-CoA dioxygenase family protein [Methylomirabilota bacterium]
MDPEPAIAPLTVSADWDAEHPLSEAALAAYASHGCLRLRGFAPPGLLGRFREEAATLIGLVLDELGLTGAASTIARFDRGLDLLLAADRARVGRLYLAMRKLPSVYGLITVPRVWAVMRQIMGTRLPGIYPGGTGVRMDHPGEDTYLSPWHQEYPYNLTSDNAVTLWLPLVDVDESNGCLLLVPGSQRLGALPVRVRDALNERRNANETLEIDGVEAVLARHAAVSVPAAAGDALVFHTYLLHRSQPNRTGATRWTLQARYFDFLNPTAIHRDWVGGMNEGVDFRRYHPELVAGSSAG